jgi:hypothetical protein
MLASVECDTLTSVNAARAWVLDLMIGWDPGQIIALVAMVRRIPLLLRPYM